MDVYEKKHLRYIDDQVLGIKRKPIGQSFRYLDPNGVKISNQNILARIDKLAIPPAWEEVWISPFIHGHIQATGLDSKGRKQYIYHEIWNQIQTENKFNKMIFFGEILPKIRRRVKKDMGQRGLGREKVLATVVWLLENTYIRIGNDEYAKDNHSFGLTTLRTRHVDIKKGKIRFEFMGKSGVKHVVDITHPKVIKVIQKCIELPGYQLFQCIDEELNKHVIDSADVNNYLQEVTGEEITAKEFRTWGGTVLATSLLKQLEFTTEAEASKNIVQTVKRVAQHLRNTPTICRNYYIHPLVLETYQQKKLIPFLKRLDYGKKNQELTKDEYGALTLLKFFSSFK